MKFWVLGGLIGCLAMGCARAQSVGVQVRGGDVYVRSARGTLQLTRDGHVGEATMSRDGALIAYVHTGAVLGIGTKNDLYLCSVQQGSCVLTVAGRDDPDTKANLTSIQTLRFSLQASQKADGTLAGSLFFLSDAGGANTMTVHRVKFGGMQWAQLPGAAVVFVTYANSLEIVPNGMFAGALAIEQQTYTSQGACGQRMIFDPNTQKILQLVGGLDC